MKFKLKPYNTFLLALLFCFGLVVSAQVFIPFAYWSGAVSPVLTISDGPTYDFGTLTVNAVTDKTFTVTNTGNTVAGSITAVAFGSAVYSFKGGSYPGTGGTCGTTLSAGQSCAIVVTTTSASTGTFNDTISLNYRSQTANLNSQRALTSVYTNTVYQLGWINTPSFIKVNDCQAVTVQRQDSAGNPVTIASATNITGLLFNNGTAGTYYTTSACSTTTTTATIAAGTNSVVVYFRSTTSNQTGILVATAAGVISASQNVTITTAPTKLFINPAPTIKTNTCTIVPIYSVDNSNFQSNVSANTTVNLTTSGSNTYYSDSACTTSITSTTLLAGNSLVNVYTQSATVQAGVVLTAAATGLTTSNKTVNFNSSLTWWNASWTRRIRIDINNSDQASAFNDQPLLVRLTSTNINYALIQASGADIRFVDADDTTVLSYQVEEWNYGGTSDL